MLNRFDIGVYLVVTALLALAHAATLETRPAMATHAYNPGETELIRAAYGGNLPKARRLIAQGANVNERGRSTGNTPLMTAAIRGHYDIVELLLKNGAKTDIRDNKGRTALMQAASTSTFSKTPVGDGIVKLLIAHGASVSARDNQGDTALIKVSKYSISDQSADIVQALLDNRAPINTKDKRGRTALWWVGRQLSESESTCDREWTASVRRVHGLLLRHGAKR